MPMMQVPYELYVRDLEVHVPFATFPNVQEL